LIARCGAGILRADGSGTLPRRRVGRPHHAAETTTKTFITMGGPASPSALGITSPCGIHHQIRTLPALAQRIRNCYTPPMFGGLLHKAAVTDWSSLSREQREDIEYRMRLALGFVTVTGVTARWKGPGEQPHWQLIVESPWCSDKSPRAVDRTRKHAIKIAKLDVPKNGVVLKDSQQ
jgi:hypothetical protein